MLAAGNGSSSGAKLVGYSGSGKDGAVVSRNEKLPDSAGANPGESQDIESEVVVGTGLGAGLDGASATVSALKGGREGAAAGGTSKSVAAGSSGCTGAGG